MAKSNLYDSNLSRRKLLLAGGAVLVTVAGTTATRAETMVRFEATLLELEGFEFLPALVMVRGRPDSLSIMWAPDNGPRPYQVMAELKRFWDDKIVCDLLIEQMRATGRVAYL